MNEYTQAETLLENSQIPPSQLTQLVKNNGGYETFIEYQIFKNNEAYPADFSPLDKREYWKRQDKTNKGWQGKWRDSRISTREDNDTVIRGMAEDLGLTRAEHRRAVACFHALDLGEGGLNKLHMAFAVCAWVIHTNERDTRRYSHLINEENRDPEIDRSREAIGLSIKDYGKAHNKMKKLLPYEQSFVISEDDYLLQIMPDLTDYDVAEM